MAAVAWMAVPPLSVPSSFLVRSLSLFLPHASSQLGARTTNWMMGQMRIMDVATAGFPFSDFSPLSRFPVCVQCLLEWHSPKRRPPSPSFSLHFLFLASPSKEYNRLRRAAQYCRFLTYPSSEISLVQRLQYILHIVHAFSLREGKSSLQVRVLKAQMASVHLVSVGSL